MFCFCSDKEEFLFLLNLKKSRKVKTEVLVDQNWLNEVYRFENFNIGLRYNVQTAVDEVKKEQ